MQLTAAFKQNVLTALLERHAAAREAKISDKQFATQYAINPSVFNTLKNHGYQDKLLTDAAWLMLGRKLDISNTGRKWATVTTDVFIQLSGDMLFCKAYSKSMMCADETEIGKTHTAKYLARTEANVFYLDASQHKTKRAFVYAVAAAVGVQRGKTYEDTKAELKYALQQIEQPLVIVDEAGDLDYQAFLELKELWNATEGLTGWFLIGADGLKAKLEAGMRNKKVGYKEMFSRFSGKISRCTPLLESDRQKWYKNLITAVFRGQGITGEVLNAVVAKALVKDAESGYQGGLRRAEAILLLMQNQAAHE